MAVVAFSSGAFVAGIMWQFFVVPANKRAEAAEAKEREANKAHMLKLAEEINFWRQERARNV